MKMKTFTALQIVVLFLLILFSSVSSIHASSQPQMVEIHRTPLNPPPNVSVNITCSVVDTYGVVNITLHYSINESSFTQENLQIIDGDYSNGTYIGQIPPLPKGTHVEYYVEAKDRIGYIRQSASSYDVSADNAPPVVLSVERKNPVGNPVLSSENVTIEAVIEDGGSGVKNASICYSTVPWSDNYLEIPMEKVNSNDFNCTFAGVIPLFSPNTRVFYFISASDFANNAVKDSTQYQYYVGDRPQDSLYVQVAITSVDPQNLTANATIFVSGSLFHDNDTKFLSLNIENAVTYYYNGTSQIAIYDEGPWININFPSQSTVGRFWFSQDNETTFHLIGDPNKYPFDSYSLNLTVTIHWSQINRLQSEAVAYSYKIGDTWKLSQPLGMWILSQAATNNTTDASGQPVVICNFDIVRDLNGNVGPLILLITVLFFLVGGTLLVEPSKLNERLGVFIGVFIFVTGLFFSPSLLAAVPTRIGLTIFETLLLWILISSGVLMIGSFFCKGTAMCFEQKLNLSRSVFSLKLSHKRVGKAAQKLLQFASVLKTNFGLLVDLVLIISLYVLWLKDALAVIPPPTRLIIQIGIFFGVSIRVALKVVIFSVRKKTEEQVV